VALRNPARRWLLARARRKAYVRFKACALYHPEETRTRGSFWNAVALQALREMGRLERLMEKRHA
jgi:hypothetical protein